MGDTKLDPALCRKLAALLRERRLSGDVMQWIDRQYLPADDETLADRVVREIRDGIDGGRCEPLETFEGETAPAIATQLTAAAELAANGLSAEERAVIELADAWLDDPCKGLGLHREHDLATAVRVLRRARAAGLAASFDRAAVAIAGESAAQLTARLNDNLKAHPDRAFDDSDVQRVDINLGDDSRKDEP